MVIVFHIEGCLLEVEVEVVVGGTPYVPPDVDDT